MKTVIVLGMHRSGTSSVARALSTMGIELGDNLLDAKQDNLKGFWEDNTLLEINESILKLNGKNWDSFGPINTPLPDKELLKATKYLCAQHEVHDTWGFKDPRSMRLISFWEAVSKRVNSELQYCLVIRNPLSVIDSLKKRNSFNERKSALLWYAYYMDALSSLKGQKLVVIDYDTLMMNPRDEMLRVSSALDKKERLNTDELNEYCQGFIDSSLRHSKYTLNDLDNSDSVSEKTKELYKFLLEISRDELIALPKDYNKNIDDWSFVNNNFPEVFELINELAKSSEELLTDYAYSSERLEIALKHVEHTLSERDSALNERDIELQRHQMALECIASYKSDVELLSSKCLALEKELEAIKSKENSSLIGKIKNFLK
ncbi:sulfotransferase family protein [Vibrio hangzhouensis]|uniref:Sulfotransferase family protein n=1 Tax=Vibrio hangzhouensis TaxID=462991 RepID=A0A1H6C1K9_9VIBR|nr:sulfotransferase family protein [Vibrio hangzhouensis]SEG66236.1 hypothetical protein SAMN04488244_12830 [Vibrio hangzhouensis]